MYIPNFGFNPIWGPTLSAFLISLYFHYSEQLNLIPIPVMSSSVILIPVNQWDFSLFKNSDIIFILDTVFSQIIKLTWDHGMGKFYRHICSMSQWENPMNKIRGSAQIKYNISTRQRIIGVGVCLLSVTLCVLIYQNAFQYVFSVYYDIRG